ncbi:hypothetical protein MP638_004852 [Amoeboaphelidium occidentale]|nr:hypothetical protein MP638_004852 [Amoeboaphelidium occidentale]
MSDHIEECDISNAYDATDSTDNTLTIQSEAKEPVAEFKSTLEENNIKFVPNSKHHTHLIHPKTQRRLFLCFTVFIIILTIAALCLRLVVPMFVRRAFANTNSNPDFVWPAFNVSTLEQEGFTFQMKGIMDFTAWVPTKIIFESQVYLETGDTHVASIDVPDLHLQTHPWFIDKYFQVHLHDPDYWELLCKLWLARAFAHNVSPGQIPPTWWTIRAQLTVQALGMTWNNIDVERRQIWNGGLDEGVAPYTLKLMHWNLFMRPSLGIRLELNGNSKSKVGADFGQLMFSIHAIRYNRTRYNAVPIRLADVVLPKFFYGLGEQNFTIVSQIPLAEQGVTGSLVGVVDDYLRNRTFTLVFSNLSNQFGSRVVPWMSNAINSMSLYMNATRTAPLAAFGLTWVSQKLAENGRVGMEVRYITNLFP